MYTLTAFEQLYAKKNEAAWTFRQPHKELVKLVREKKILPCKALEVGCGEGWHSIYLASYGFDVTGIDFSRRAIKYARENAKEKDVRCKFLAMDWKDIGKIGGNSGSFLTGDSCMKSRAKVREKFTPERLHRSLTETASTCRAHSAGEAVSEGAAN